MNSKASVLVTTCVLATVSAAAVFGGLIRSYPQNSISKADGELRDRNADKKASRMTALSSQSSEGVSPRENELFSQLFLPERPSYSASIQSGTFTPSQNREYVTESVEPTRPARFDGDVRDLPQVQSKSKTETELE